MYECINAERDGEESGRGSLLAIAVLVLRWVVRWAIRRGRERRAHGPLTGGGGPLPGASGHAKEKKVRGIYLTRRKPRATRGRYRRTLPKCWTTYHVAYGGRVYQLGGCKSWGVTFVRSSQGDETHDLVPGFTSYPELKAMKKKKATASAAGPVHLAPMESKLLAKLHSLVAHCATLRYDDGDPRKPGEIRFRPVGAMWVCEAIDYDACVRLQCIQATLDDAIAGLALLLDTEDAPWEECSWMKQGAAKKAKK